MCSLGLSRQYVILGSDNGLAPNRRQAVIWTNDDLVHWRIHASLGLNELLTKNDNGWKGIYHMCLNVDRVHESLKQKMEYFIYADSMFR